MDGCPMSLCERWSSTQCNPDYLATVVDNRSATVTRDEQCTRQCKARTEVLAPARNDPRLNRAAVTPIPTRKAQYIHDISPAKIVRVAEWQRQRKRHLAGD